MGAAVLFLVRGCDQGSLVCLIDLPCERLDLGFAGTVVAPARGAGAGKHGAEEGCLVEAELCCASVRADCDTAELPVLCAASAGYAA